MSNNPTVAKIGESGLVFAKDKTTNQVTTIATTADMQIGLPNQSANLSLTGAIGLSTLDITIAEGSTRSIPDSLTNINVTTTGASGTATLRLPAAPKKGQLVYIKDAGGNAGTVSITVVGSPEGTKTSKGTTSHLIDGSTSKTITANYGILQLLWNSSSWSVISSTASSAPLDASYVVIGSNATLTNERILTAGPGVSIVDGGAGSTITISASGVGTGDVIGPASAADNAIARFDLTTGKVIQNSGVTISDSNDIITPGDVAINGGDLTSTATTFNLLNSTVTTLNVGGAATTATVGASTADVVVGRAEIGAWPAGTSYAFFGNSDYNHSVAGNYALIQASSAGTKNTWLNAPTGGKVYIANNDAALGYLDDNEISLTGKASTAQTITLGSMYSNSSTTIQAGTGDIGLNSSGSVNLNPSNDAFINFTSNGVDLGSIGYSTFFGGFSTINLIGVSTDDTFLTLGNSYGGSATSIYAGTGGILLSGSGATTTITGSASGQADAYIGSVEIGVHPYWGRNYAMFGHKDLSHSVAGNYGLVQKNDGTTWLNAAATKKLYLANNDSALGYLDDNEISLTGKASTNQTVTLGSTYDSSNLTLNAGSGSIDIGSTPQSRSTNIATGAAVQTVTLGSTTGASSLSLNAGTGDLNLDATDTIQIKLDGTTVSSLQRDLNIVDPNGPFYYNTIQIGNSALLSYQPNYITVGSTNYNSSLTLKAGTGGIDIGTSAAARTTNIATGAAAQTVTLGSTTGASSLTLNAGTGNIGIETYNGLSTISIGTVNQPRTIEIGTASTQAQTVNIATGGATNDINIGNYVAGTNTTIAGDGVQVYTNGGTIAIDSSGTGGTVNIDAFGYNSSVNVGTGPAIKTVTVGSTTSTSTTTIQGGSSGVSVNSSNGNIVLNPTAVNGTIYLRNNGSDLATFSYNNVLGNTFSSINLAGKSGDDTFVDIGSSYGSSNVNIYGGSGGVSIDGGIVKFLSNAKELGFLQNLNILGADYSYITLTGSTNTTTQTRIGNTYNASSLTLDAGTGQIKLGTSDSSRTIDIGTAATSKQEITIGNDVAGTTTTILAGGSGFAPGIGNIYLSGAIGTSYYIGGEGGTGNIAIGQSNDDNTINVGSNGNNTLKTQTINVGSGTGKSVVTIGNSSGASSLSLRAGTGNISIDGGTVKFLSNTKELGFLQSLNVLGVDYSYITLTGSTGTTTQTRIGNTYDVSSLTLDAGSGSIKIGTSDSSRTISIGTASSAKQEITIGNDAAGTTTTILAGGSGFGPGIGNIYLSGAIGASYYIGGEGGTGNIVFGQSIDDNTISIGASGNNTSKTQTIQIGNGTGKSVVAIGSTAGASSLTLNAGTGYTTINGHEIIARTALVAYPSDAVTDYPLQLNVVTGGNTVRWAIGADTGDDLNFSYSLNSTTVASRGYLSNGADVTAIDFTGQHRNYPVGGNVLDFSDKIGLIVASVGQYKSLTSGSAEISINEALPLVELSTKRNQKSVFGVISDHEDPNETSRDYVTGNWGSVYEKMQNDDRLIVNSLGEGAIWICNINGNLQNGDYITSCEVPGYGMKQDDDILHNYTAAKITCDCDFFLDSTVYRCEEFQHEGKTYRRAFVGCTYHCG